MQDRARSHMAVVKHHTGGPPISVALHVYNTIKDIYVCHGVCKQIAQMWLQLV